MSVVHVAPAGHWQANRSSNKNHSLLVSACKRGAVGSLLVTSDAFRNRGSPQLASAVTAEITQNINSPGRVRRSLEEQELMMS
jgi:hypothetical protein